MEGAADLTHILSTLGNMTRYVHRAVYSCSPEVRGRAIATLLFFCMLASVLSEKGRSIKPSYSGVPTAPSPSSTLTASARPVSLLWDAEITVKLLILIEAFVCARQQIRFCHSQSEAPPPPSLLLLLLLLLRAERFTPTRRWTWHFKTAHDKPMKNFEFWSHVKSALFKTYCRKYAFFMCELSLPW